MHDHNKDGGGKGMMWMMIPCLLLIGVLFLFGGKVSGDGYLWPILIGVFVIAHVWMMFKGHGGHGGHGGTDTEDTIDLPADLSAKALASAEASAQAGNASAKQPSAKDEHKHNGSCH